MKSALKERHSYNATDMIRNATEELKSLSKKWLTGMFLRRSQALAEVYS
jgi:hypothetical protein